MSGSLSVMVVRALDVALARSGKSSDDLLLALGIPRGMLERSSARLPAEIVFRAIERATELTGDACFCMRAANEIPLGTIDILDFAMRSSETLREALERAVRYYSIIDDRSELRLEESLGVARLVVSREIATSPRVATELLFALLLARGRELTGRPWPLREVCFLAGPPSDPAAHEDFFGAKVRFSSGRNEIVFDAAVLDAPCIAHDEALGRFFDRHADGMLEELAEQISFVRKVKLAIGLALIDSEPAVDATAKRLALSSRTLQRRLEECGTSHKELVEDARRELTLKLLADPAVPIPQIAYRVGFCDTSTFYRAFKRWTGSTPGLYRRGEARPPMNGSISRAPAPPGPCPAG